jgi:23S rRNA (uracil1939-C5)-methyltransferase
MVEGASSSLSPDDDTSIRITGFASGGEGVGRLSDGRVVFVEGGVPGDLVELLDVRRSQKLLRARAGRLLEASRDRAEPRCPHFGTCGGCRWQHVRYEAQLAAKRQIVIDALRRIGGITVATDLEIVPSPDAYGYRARARWVESEQGIGYRVRGSRSASPVECCPVLVPAAEAALIERVSGRRTGAGPVTPPHDAEAADSSASDPRSAPTSSRTRSPGSRARRAKEWVVTVGSTGPALVTQAGTSRQARRDRQGLRAVSIEVCGEKLRVSGESFVQGNALLWDALARSVVEACTTSLDQIEAARFVELYAGIGFFTIPLARRFAGGVALESDRSGLADLAFNLRAGGVSEAVEILAGRVEARGDLGARFEQAGVLLVDPPRTGLDAKVRDAIAAQGPPRLVYVSCDPATLARDLRTLRAAGYEIAALRAFDLFPQTPHVETIVRLERAPRD